MDAKSAPLIALKEKLDNIPNIIKGEVQDAVDKITLQINTKKIQAVVREQLATNDREKENAPGSWNDFRKTWLIPVIMVIITALVQAGLTYIVISRPVP